MYVTMHRCYGIMRKILNYVSISIAIIGSYVLFVVRTLNLLTFLYLVGYSIQCQESSALVSSNWSVFVLAMLCLILN